MFEVVLNKRLVYKFGCHAYNWRKSELEKPGAPRVPCVNQVIKKQHKNKFKYLMKKSIYIYLYLYIFIIEFDDDSFEVFETFLTHIAILHLRDYYSVLCRAGVELLGDVDSVFACSRPATSTWYV